MRVEFRDKGEKEPADREVWGLKFRVQDLRTQADAISAETHRMLSSRLCRRPYRKSCALSAPVSEAVEDWVKASGLCSEGFRMHGLRD